MAHAHHVEKTETEVHVTHKVPREFIATRRVIYYILDVIELLLAARFILKLVAVGESGFVRFIYSITEPLIAPFRGIVQNTAVSGGVFEWASLIAIIVYAIIAYLLVRLLRLLFD